MVDRGELREDSGSRADHRRLVRHLSGRFAAQLHGTEGPRRQRGGAQRPAPARHHRRPLRLGANHRRRSISAPALPFDENDVILDWYDYLFLGKQNQFAGGKPVRIFVMGENKWRDEDAWPLERAVTTSYFLRSTGKANSASGDGELSTSAPDKQAVDSFVYDPANPVPTVGGPLCCDPMHLAPGARDQKEVEARPDVLVYSTPPLDSDLEVTGPITLDLFAKSSAVDTDFTAKLVDVWPNGFAQNLTEGILRARYRESTSDGQAHRSRQGLRVQDRSVVHQQCLFEGPQDPPGSEQQQLPALRPQPEYRQTSQHQRSIREGNQHHPSRRRASLSAAASGGAEIVAESYKFE